MKQELPVIPKYVADWIDENRERYENIFFTIGYDLYDNSIHRSVGDWIIKNEEKFVRAWFGAYEVEEQKFYVLDSEDIPLLERANNQTCKTTTGLSIYEDGRERSRFELTEQEIKNYDERFWSFAEPVEEVIE